jgi:ATP-dependent Lhr-like helicase
MEAVRPVLELQAAWSELPGPGQLLLERSKVREGHQWFMYPFEGRAVNEGLAALVAYRITRSIACSITITPNDYGFELLSNEPLELDEPAWRKLLSTDNLLDDLLACLNGGELARRQFRDIARVAGLVFQGYPGAPKSAKQLQASSGLIYDVFTEYDAGNLLLEQARREVLERQLEASRMLRALTRISGQELSIHLTPRLTPLAFPLWAARIQTTHLSSERASTRIERMLAQLERAAGGDERDEAEAEPKSKPRRKTKIVKEPRPADTGEASGTRKEIKTNRVALPHNGDGRLRRKPGSRGTSLTIRSLSTKPLPK